MKKMTQLRKRLDHMDASLLTKLNGWIPTARLLPVWSVTAPEVSERTALNQYMEH